MHLNFKKSPIENTFPLVYDRISGVYLTKLIN